MRKRISVVMALYKPNVKWLEEQLISIDNQICNYEVEILILNDDPKDCSCENIIKKSIHNFKYTILKNNQNNGITKSFEILTRYASGDYIAYCDQDDVWYPNKLEECANEIEEKKIVACACNYEIIDENGDKTGLMSSYPNFFSKKDEKKKRKFIVNPNIIGTSLMIKSEIAKNGMPFPLSDLHDKWLIVYAASVGDIGFINKPLMGYRRHSSNNSSILHGINNVDEYYKRKVLRDYMFYKEVYKRLIEERKIYYEEYMWANSRYKYYCCPSVHNAIRLLRYISIRPEIVVFELLLPLMGYSMIGKTVKVIKRYK